MRLNPSSNCGCCGGCTPCFPCCIPQHDLTGTLLDGPLPPDTFTLTYTPGADEEWAGFVNHSGILLSFFLRCTGGTTTLDVIEQETGSPWTTTTLVDDAVCDPFHVHWTLGVGTTINFYADA